MRQVFGWMTVVVLCCAARAAAGEEPSDPRLLQAQTAYDTAIKLYEAGQYADAMANGEKALALREEVLGSAHPDVANCLDLLGLHHLLQGNPVRAEPLLQRALAIRETALGKNHLDVAQTLFNLADLYKGQGFYDRAEPLYMRALAIREAALGKNHSLVAEPLHHLGNLYEEQGFPARAEPLLQRALAIREASFGQSHPEIAQSLVDLAYLYLNEGLYARAEPLLQRALAIREAALGKDHPLVVRPLHHLASLYESQGMYGQAEPLLQRALTLQKAALDKNPPDVADSLDHLASLYESQGMYGQAEPLYARALALREATLGKNHLLVSRSLFNLAWIYRTQGLYGRAEPLFERTLGIQEAAFGKHHFLVAVTLANLAWLYQDQGLYARAEPLYQRILTIFEATVGANTYVAQALNQLASLYQAQGLYARAEQFYQRALAIAEAALGKNHPLVGDTLNDLASLYQAQGLYRRAEPLYQRALAIEEAAFGKNHPQAADSVNHLADLYSAQGLYGQAEPLYERALTIWEATLGKNHPSVAGALNHLAVVRLAQHRLDKALPLFTRAFTLSEQRLRQEAPGFSESRLASFLQFLRTDEERLYALLRAHPDDARVRRLALSAALLFRDRSVEETADISRTIYRGLDAQDRDTFARLGGLRTQLAQLSLQGPGSLPLPAYRQRLEELSVQGDALEADLAQRSASLRALAALPSPADIVDRVAQALPKDAALVEFISYEDRPLVLEPGVPQSRPSSQPRYLALVLFPDATIRAQDLGLAEPMDSAASRLRDALANHDAAFQAPAQALYQFAFQPLLPLLGNTHHLFLLPDGQLSLVPFAALHDGHQFLVDAFDFTYLSSGRDLLPRPQEEAAQDSVVVLADPDFSSPLPASTPSLEDASAQGEPSSTSERFFSSLRSNLAHRAWALASLPGTRQEARAIQRLLPQAQLFLGPAATKQRLLQLPTPGILHLATHGFFLEDTPEPTASRGVVHFGALGEDTLALPPADPLLRSGLLLAGARSLTSSSSTQPSLDSALVTALELAGLNLWGTQLVVLSACDTGRGAVKLGQGVYGLRRAFLVAGAETVVTSLWKVEDQTTSTLMETYYRNLLAGQGRATALREAMRWLRSIQPHPYYWAPFIALGRDTPLRALAIAPHAAPRAGASPRH